jgi:hypothetical protein
VKIVGLRLRLIYRRNAPYILLTLYQYITHDVLKKTLVAIPITHTIEEIEPVYRSLKGKHGKIILTFTR